MLYEVITVVTRGDNDFHALVLDRLELLGLDPVAENALVTERRTAVDDAAACATAIVMLAVGGHLDKGLANLVGYIPAHFMKAASPDHVTGIVESVITSYSIHYTKLYDPKNPVGTG